MVVVEVNSHVEERDDATANVIREKTGSLSEWAKIMPFEGIVGS